MSQLRRFKDSDPNWTLIKVVNGIFQQGDQQGADGFNQETHSKNQPLVSFQLLDRSYQHHCSYNLRAHFYEGSPQFRLDATFYLEKDRFFPQTVSFQSINFDQYYISHKDFILQIAISDYEDVQRKDASFIQIQNSERSYDLFIYLFL